MHNFKELLVWQKSHELVLNVYMVSKKIPKEELFGITNQLRRAAVSIAANIAEGAGRNTPADFVRFLDIANGSSFEVESLMLLCKDLSYLTESEVDVVMLKLEEVQKLTYKFRLHLLQKTI